MQLILMKWQTALGYFVFFLTGLLLAQVYFPGDEKSVGISDKDILIPIYKENLIANTPLKDNQIMALTKKISQNENKFCLLSDKIGKFFTLEDQYFIKIQKSENRKNIDLLLDKKNTYLLQPREISLSLKTCQIQPKVFYGNS